ncbi:hypothetical protein FKM82_000028 [Ascaphus truei]
MNMASCLFECLCEAELEKYYPHFVGFGLQRIEELAKITMKDYPRLGVHNMEDRKRLFQLIKIIQSVEEEGKEFDKRTPLQPGSVYLQPQPDRSGTRRQLQFDSSFEKNNILFTQSELCGLSHFYSIKHPGELFEMALPADPHYSQKAPAEDLGIDGGFTAKGHNPNPIVMSGIAPSLSDSEVPVIHRVTHVSGYNYGVPQTCLRPSTSEKEGPWTETDKIRVCVRKRPLSLREERRGEVNVVTVEDKETIFIYEKKEAVNLKQYILQHVFYFDEVFSEAFTNQDVYMKTAHPLIQHIFNGGNATCFAYGQTGAGKTYTMIGTQKNPGLYALAAKDIFQQLESAQPREDYLVWISFYEIYCGQLYDLLNGRKRLFAREDGKHVVQIVGLREVQVSSVDLLLEMILKGSKERSTGATGVNSDSSRSHAIIQIQIKDAANRKLGRMSFIDLAGSERASDARESDKQTKIEGAEINQSLLALKECIRALDQEQAHTPFRQSKLTQVLKDSFIGNSKTCMIANVSPSHIATEHTLNTLRYADRVKELKKRMKCTTPCSNRARATTCLSPKRMQSSPSVLGEKISPKKVKLGLQNTFTSNPAKFKPYPSVFHPTNIPLSSTPKAYTKSHALKGNPSQAWLNHTTPVKGIIRPGNGGGKKKSEDLHDKNPTSKTLASNNTSEAGEINLGDNFTRYLQPSKFYKIQAVQPVQKQIVSRAGLFFGDRINNSSSGSDYGPSNRPTSLNLECWTSNLPQQKEREQHLRCYHQQFQQPPILQQKLQYQPLEKCLDRYKPQEIRVDNSSPKSPSYSQVEEKLHLEDLDDSDFSEDSFSYASNQKKKGRKEEFCERLSFFLHQRSPEAEIGKSTEQEQALSFNCREAPDYNQSDSWRCVNGSAFSRSKEPVEHRDHTENTVFWSSGEDPSSASGSSKSNNTPEKPYSSQEDLTSQLKKIKYTSTTHRHEKESCVYPNVCSLLQEHGDQSAPTTTGSGAALTDTTMGKVQSLQERNVEHYDEAVSTSSDSASGLMAPLSVSLLQDNWSVESGLGRVDQELQTRSEDSANNFNLDDAWELDAQRVPVHERPTRKNMSQIVKQMLRYDEALNLQNSPHREKEWLPQACNGSNCYNSSLGSSPSCNQEVLDDKGSAREPNLKASPQSRPSDSLSIRDATLDFAIPRYNEHQISEYYDADTEESIIGMKPEELERREPNNSPENAVSHRDSKNKSILNVSPVDLCKNNTNVRHKSSNRPGEGHFWQPEPNLSSVEIQCFEDSFKLPFEASELERLKTKLIKCIFSPRSVEEEQISSCADTLPQKSPRNTASVCSQTSIADLLSRQASARERTQQLVVQAHREQLNGMTALCTEEKLLLSQMPKLDFKEYVTKLDEIMVLKSKCIQSMRDQLQRFMACPQTEEAADRTSTH